MSQPALTPRLVVSDAAAAQSFYVEAFGATAGPCYRNGDGNVVHAEVHLLGTTFSLVDAVWDAAPTGDRGTPVLLHLCCADPDALAASAVAAGGTVLIPIDDRAWGKREGRVIDPFGHGWILSRADVALSDDELRERGAIA